ncbi:MAG: glycosyltransferase family 39 protein, partial [Bacteroidetes bacterium]|nr:glycosyltransferase family 39 protein [Bacteroidota bacterium]
MDKSHTYTYIKAIHEFFISLYPMSNRLHYIFLALWLIINLLQAHFTELMHDEAYYWMYSRFPQFGYFHQAPMIGILIKIGYMIFENELGVRLISVFLTTASLHLIYLMIQNKDPLVFWAIAFSTFIFNVGGFLAVPDNPLIFFACLFFYFFRKYQKQDNWGYALALGACTALLLYSKYAGFLIIGLTLISNPHLFKRTSLYVAGFLSLILFVPHIHWQVVNDFPGINHNLSGHFGELLTLKYIASYPAGQIFIIGPITGFITIYAAFTLKRTSDFHRTLLKGGIFMYPKD